MKLIKILSLSFLLPLLASADDGFVELFNGTDLTGWKLNETPESFKVENGEIVAMGPRCHLFYVGDVNGANFKDFEAKLKVLVKPSSNAGFFFHTTFQDEGWPSQGYEAQICSTTYKKDPKKTGSLYGVENVMDTAPHDDDVWFDYHLIVRGSQITIKINGKTVVDYTEPPADPNAKKPLHRRLSNGTFAIQCHDPGSEVRFKSIKVKPL